MKIFAGVFLVSAVLAGLLTAAEGSAIVLFGWGFFLARVGPQAAPDWPSVAVGVAASALFAVGVHRVGRAWWPTWRWRSTLAVVGGVFLAFASGVAAIGMMHQIGWLAASDRPLTGEALTRWSDTRNNLKMMGISLANYNDALGRLPAGGTFTSDGRMLHSWEALQLAYGAYSTSGIDWERPWNDPVNMPYFKSVIPEFINPSFRTADLQDSDGYGLSHYAANSRVMSANTSMKLADIADGTSNTILIGEVNTGFRPWGHPVNWRDPAAGLAASPENFGGAPGTGGAWFAMADGSVRFVRDGVKRDVLKALATPRGNDGPVSGE